MEKYDKYVWIIIAGAFGLVISRWVMIPDTLTSLALAFGTLATGYMARGAMNSERIGTLKLQLKYANDRLKDGIADTGKLDSRVTNLEELLKPKPGIYTAYAAELNNLRSGIRKIGEANTATLAISDIQPSGLLYSDLPIKPGTESNSL